MRFYTISYYQTKRILRNHKKSVPLIKKYGIKSCVNQEKYNAYSVIPHNVLASDYLTDCHQALFFQQDTLVY